jgi:hypothetical protein
MTGRKRKYVDGQKNPQAFAGKGIFLCVAGNIPDI